MRERTLLATVSRCSRAERGLNMTTAKQWVMLVAVPVMMTAADITPSIAGGCLGGAPVVGLQWVDANRAKVIWAYTGNCTDVYHLRLGMIGENVGQLDEGGGRTCPQGSGACASRETFTIDANKGYKVQVQGCSTHTLQSSDCTAWGVVYLNGDLCKPGFVWREADPRVATLPPWPGHRDHVCVTPATRQAAADDNAQAQNRLAHPGADDICKVGFVWREAFPNDHTCVTPQVRQQARDDNAQALSRRRFPDIRP
jgi:u-PAR/Ly-6 domain